MSALPSSPGAARAVLSVPFGPAALGALAGAIRGARGGDPLAPVTVVIPSGHAAVSVRRHLARLPAGDGRVGLVNVHWRSLPQVGALLAGAGDDSRPPITGLVRRAAVRGALADVPSAFAAVADNPATEDRLAAAFNVFDLLDADALARVAGANRRGHELVALHRAYRARCSRHATEHDAVDRAVTAVDAWASTGAAGDVVRRALGAVIVYLPSQLPARERSLLGALARLVPVTVILGLAGDAVADAATERLRDALLDTFGPDTVTSAPVLGTGAAPAPVDTTFLRAPDPDEEARAAVRRVLEALEAGTAPEDVAIVSRVAEPYQLLVHELLDAARVPHHTAAGPSLAQTVAGRALLGFVRVAERGFHRAELFRWVRSAPIRLPDGSPVPSWFDALARRAGVGAGLDQWRRRLARHRTERVETARTDEQRARRAADVDAVVAFVEHLAALAEPPTDTSWAAQAAWAAHALDVLLGGPDRVASAEPPWPERELAAYDEVHAVVRSLAALDEIDPGPGVDRFLRVLADEVAHRRRPVGRFGHGVFVGGVDDLVGARHELVVVLGMAEGQFPPRPAGDPVLSDDLLAAVGDDPAVRRRDRADERRSFVALRAASPHQQLSFARVDPRSQRAALPSRWFLDELGAVRGTYTGFDDLDAVEHPAFTDVASFESATRAAPVPVSAGEAAMGGLLGGAAVDDVGLARGIEAVRARTQGTFGEWTGEVHPARAPRFGDERPASSTRLETWAKCPYRYFLGQVLNVGEYDEQADADAINNLDRGSLVHEVLENVVAEALDRPPSEPWSEADHERMRAELDAIARAYEAEGRTGRPLLWAAERERLLRLLEQTLATDTVARAERGAGPVAVELHFGLEEEAPAEAVRFTLPSGHSVLFHGKIDRVDRDPVTGRLVVIDYKTGKKSSDYKALADDITCGGRHLQLVIYGEAARRHFGADAVESYFWFVEAGALVGGTIGDAERRRFLDVLQHIVDGIEGGVFPANPGDRDAYFNTWDNCGWCPYTRLCPATRAEQWTNVQLSPSVAGYVAMGTPDEGSAA